MSIESFFTDRFDTCRKSTMMPTFDSTFRQREPDLEKRKYSPYVFVCHRRHRVHHHHRRHQPQAASTIQRHTSRQRCPQHHQQRLSQHSIQTTSNTKTIISIIIITKTTTKTILNIIKSISTNSHEIQMELWAKEGYTFISSML